MHPKLLLRGEGLILALFALVSFYVLAGPWWLFLVLILAPDLSMLGYLAGSRFGSITYNAAHTYIAPVALGALGLWQGAELLVLLALIWTTHIGFDRVIGYGLKYPTAFADTHLTRIDTSPGSIEEPAAIDPAD